MDYSAFISRKIPAATAGGSAASASQAHSTQSTRRDGRGTVLAGLTKDCIFSVG